jgi:protein-L-isoaspartate(D-aspartate) O-methyltransferase
MKALTVRRDIMINEHLIARDISDPAVIAAMRAVPREEFVPGNLMDSAYEDHPLPIGEGQTISQPYMVALMTQSLELSATDRVLEIGTGSGYSAAVTSRIAAQVYTVEHFARLAQSAAERLERLGYDNIRVLVGDGSLGLPEFAPYDAIVVTAGSPEVPKPLMEQLAVGGRLVIPVGRYLHLQTLIRLRRVSAHDYQREELCAVQFVPLVGAAGWHEHD